MAIKDAIAVYAGEQLQAAGVLAVCTRTKKVLTVYRSANVVDGNCWCGLGGKMEASETFLQTAQREFEEEAGIRPPSKLYEAFTYESPDLKFVNFIGAFDDQLFPRINWESDGYAWTDLESIPRPMHYGLEALLADERSMKLLKTLLS